MEDMAEGIIALIVTLSWFFMPISSLDSGRSIARSFRENLSHGIDAGLNELIYAILS